MNISALTLPADNGHFLDTFFFFFHHILSLVEGSEEANLKALSFYLVISLLNVGKAVVDALV